MKQLVLALTLMLALAACQKQTDEAATIRQATIKTSWLGRWNGPEGTFLELAARDGGYTVTIQSLDGPATYDGRPVANGVEFERDGSTETIRPGNGQQTGMKWLLEKQDCLIVKTGEGFCRD